MPCTISSTIHEMVHGRATCHTSASARGKYGSCANAFRSFVLRILSIALSELCRRERHAVKRRLPETHARPLGITRRKIRVPTPDVIILDEIRSQVQFDPIAFVDFHRLRKGKEALSVDQL